MNNYSEKTIGTSLAFCVRDIVYKLKNRSCTLDNIIDKVVIFAGTYFKNPEEVINDYKKSYWAIFPEEAATVFQKLWDNGNIVQLGLVTNDIVYSDKLWYENFDEFVKSQEDFGRVKVANTLRVYAA